EEHEKGGLKRIVGRLRASENTPAHAQHHAAVSLQQRRKRRLISIQREVLQQLPVAEPLRAARDSAKPANRYFQCVRKRWHGELLRPSTNICPPPGKRIQVFSRALPPRPPLASSDGGAKGNATIDSVRHSSVTSARQSRHVSFRPFCSIVTNGKVHLPGPLVR